MDITIEAVVTIVGGIAGAIGGYRAGKSSELQGAASVNQLLESRMDLLERDNQILRDKCDRQQSEIDSLRGIVTQRAEVAEVRKIVERIEAKLDVN